MKIGVFSRHQARLFWYSSCFPEHIFFHINPDSTAQDEEACDSYIVDGDMLTEDRESYSDLTRYFNRAIIDALEYQEQRLCLPRPDNKYGVSYKPERQNNVKPHHSLVMGIPPGYRLHTIIHQEKCSSRQGW